MNDETEAFETELDAYRDRVEKPLWRLFTQYGRGERRWLAIGLVTSVFTYAALLVTPLALGTTIDAVFTQESAYALPLVPEAWLPEDRTDQFRLSAAIIGAALLGGAVLQWVRGVSINFFAHGVMYAIRVDAYEKMQRLDMTFFDNKETGEVMSILNNDTGNLEVFFDNALGDAVRIGVIVLGVTAALLYTNAQLAVVTLGVVPLLVAFTWWFVRIIEPRYTRHRSVIGDLNARIENGLSGIELVKTASTEEYENERVRGVSRDVFDAQMDVLKLSYFYRPGIKLVTGTALLATFIIGGLWVFSGPPPFFSGTLSVGEFVVFMLLTQRLTGPMAQLSNIVDWYENARASGKRICGLMDVPVRIENAPNPVSLPDVDGRAEYDDVTFGYVGEETVLDGVDGVGIIERGKAFVDERGRTGVEGLYAAGRLAEKPHQAIVCAGHGAEVALAILEDDDRPFYHDWVAPEGYFTDRGRDLPPGCEEIDDEERERREARSLEAVRERFAEPHPDEQETHPSLRRD